MVESLQGSGSWVAISNNGESNVKADADVIETGSIHEVDRVEGLKSWVAGFGFWV